MSGAGRGANGRAVGPVIGRLIKGVVALVILLAGLVGVPWVLLSLIGNPLPQHPTLEKLWQSLSTPDDGTLLVDLIALICWAAWLVFLISVVAELVCTLSRRRIRIRLPGFGGIQKASGGLILLVLAMFVAPNQLAAAGPAPVGPSIAAPATASATAAAGSVADRAEADSDRGSGRPPVDGGDRGRVVHVVGEGDDLWSLAEQYYGRGQDWRKISTANPELLTGGPDRLMPGWRLVIPGAASPAHQLRVQSGDTLTGIAEREYGDPAAWPGIFRANRRVLADPDLLPIGVRLVIPAEGDADPAAGTADPGPDRHGSPVRPAANPDHANAGRGSSPGVSAGGNRGSDRAEDDSSRRTEGGGSATGRAEAEMEGPAVPAPLVGVGGVLATVLIAGLVSRRQLQLRARPTGRRIPQPSPPAQQVEAALGRQQLVLGPSQLDGALRAIGRDCLRRRAPTPTLQAVRLTEHELILIMAESQLPAPVGFVVQGTRWRLAADDAAFLLQDAGVADCPQPYPALLSLGTAADGAVIMINIEAAGGLSVQADDGTLDDALAAMVAELAFTPWSEELVISVVGEPAGLAASAGRFNVGTVEDLDRLLQRWEQRAALQREHLVDKGSDDKLRSPADFRIDPELADPWTPELALVGTPPTDTQATRLRRLVQSEPRVSLSAVVSGDQLGGDWRLLLTGSEDGRITGRLSPQDWTFEAQRLGQPTVGLVQQLIDVTGSDETEPAPWWVEDFPPGTPGPARAQVVERDQREDRVDRAGTGPVGADTSPDQITAGTDEAGFVDHDREVDHERPPAVDRSWPSAAVRPRGNVAVADSVFESDDHWGSRAPGIRRGASEEFDIVPSPFSNAAPPPTPRHPTIMLLGPLDLIGAAGRPPNRAVLACIECATWLLEHPGSTAQAMAAGLVVAEGTRRSNVSRLRSWLGTDDQDLPYLPDAYSGRIVLSALVSSDWHRLQILTGTGVNVTSTEGLCKALELVRGAPLADAAPTQWHWAEEMRTDMVSVIRDIAVEITERALAEPDVDLARWAASRGLTAAPQDEFLIGARIRTEFQAGNPAEVERLALQLAAQGRALGVDLHPDTVDLLQQVMEGRLRARA